MCFAILMGFFQVRQLRWRLITIFTVVFHNQSVHCLRPHCHFFKPITITIKGLSMRRPSTISCWSSPPPGSSCTRATPSLPAISGEERVRWNLYSPSCPLFLLQQQRSGAIQSCHLQWNCRVGPGWQPDKNCFFFWFSQKKISRSQVNLQLLFIADLKHKCVAEEHKRTKPGRQVQQNQQICLSWDWHKPFF